jgi:hypothetical protein
VPQGQSGWVQKNLAPTELQSLDRPAHSKSLYRLRYPSPLHCLLCLFPWASVYCSLTGLLYRPRWTFQLWPQDAPAPTDAFRTPAAEVGTYGRGRTGKFCLNADFHGTFRDLLRAANLRHRTHGFTSLPKEGVLRIFSPLKIRRLRPGLNPRTWGTRGQHANPRPPKPLSPLHFFRINFNFIFHVHPLLPSGLLQSGSLPYRV